MKMYHPRNWFWIVAGDETQAYSSAAKTFVSIGQVDPDRITRIASMDELIQVLREANVPPYHRVAKSTIISRLTDEQLAACFAAFARPENLRIRERWYAPDQGAVNSDDPDAIGLLTAIGADPSVVLAAES